MKHVLQSLKRHQFFSLLSGVMGANILSLLAMPVLTRLYSVESFGLFALFWSVATIAGLFATLRFEVALPTIDDSQERKDLSAMALMLSIFGAGLLIPLWLMCGGVMKSAPITLEFALCLAAGAVFNSILQIQNQLSIKLNHLRALSIRNVAERLVALGASFLLAHFAEYGLILAQLLGIGTAAFYLIWANSPEASLRFFVKPHRFRFLLGKYREFPVKNGPSTVFQILAGQLPPLLYSSFFSVQALGFYSLAQRLIDAPNAVLNSAISIIYYRRMLGAPKSEMKRIFLRTQRYLALLMIGPILALCFFAKPLVILVFGAKWEPSAIYLVLLTPLLFFRVLYYAGQSLFLVLRALTQDMWISLAIFVGTVGGLCAGYAIYGTLEGAVGGSSVLAALAFLLGLSMIFKSVEKLSLTEKI